MRGPAPVVLAGSARTVERLAVQLRSAGRDPVPAVVLATEAPDDRRALDAALARLAEGGYDAIAVTSAAAVEAFARVEVPSRVWVAAVGPGTADALATHGIRVRLTPRDASAAGLLAAWPPGAGRRVLLPHSDLARPELEEGLRDRGEHPDPVVAYRTVPREPSAAAQRALAGGAAVVVTSPSAFAAIGPWLEPSTRVLAIGPTTADTVRAAGRSVELLQMKACLT